jgi:hypothetical protein
VSRVLFCGSLAPLHDVVTDEQGVTIHDPFRWIEYPSSPETLGWKVRTKTSHDRAGCPAAEIDGQIDARSSADAARKRANKRWELGMIGNGKAEVECMGVTRRPDDGVNKQGRERGGVNQRIPSVIAVSARRRKPARRRADFASLRGRRSARATRSRPPAAQSRRQSEPLPGREWCS